MKTKELLFSITSKDCEWQFFTAGGKGGQNQNKTASACRCVHKESGAVGESREYREQLLNKKAAFKRMSETLEFKKWLELEIKKKSGQLAILEDKFEKSMKKIKIEVKKDGKWTEIKEDTLNEIN